MAEEINLPEQPAVPTATPAASQPKTSWTIPLLLILSIFSLSISGYLFWQNQQLMKQLAAMQTPITSGSDPEVIPVGSPESLAEEGDPTEGWKMYESSDKKVLFKYPSNWTAEPLIFQGRIHGVISLKITGVKYQSGEPAAINIQYWDNPQKMSLEQFQTEIDAQGGRIYNLYKPSQQSTEKFTVGNMTGYYSPKSDCEPFTCEGYVIAVDNRIYEIKVFPSFAKEYKNTINQILSTFKFTE